MHLAFVRIFIRYDRVNVDVYVFTLCETILSPNIFIVTFFRFSVQLVCLFVGFISFHFTSALHTRIRHFCETSNHFRKFAFIRRTYDNVIEVCIVFTVLFLHQRISSHVFESVRVWNVPRVNSTKCLEYQKTTKKIQHNFSSFMYIFSMHKCFGWMRFF